MGIMFSLCVVGIIIFFKNRKSNFWWRWIYLFGGVYVLFDLSAIAMELKLWHELLLLMFDVTCPYWNLVLVGFIAIGFASFMLEISLLMRKLKLIN